MSLSRKNWSALSSLANQRTLEDQEEVIRERRRRNRNLSSSSEINSDLSFSTPNMVELLNDEEQSSDRQKSSIQRVEENRPSLERAQGAELEPQEALGPDDNEDKFLEILRSREMRRQKRQIEILQNIKQEQQNGTEKESEELNQTTIENPQQTKHVNKGNRESDLRTAALPQRVISGSKGKELSPSSTSTAEILKQENLATRDKKESKQITAPLPQQRKVATKGNTDTDLTVAESPHEIKPANKCIKESVLHATESPTQDKEYNKCTKGSEPRTAELPQQVKLAPLHKKETELSNTDGSSQAKQSDVHSKGKAEALTSQGKITEKAILSPTSQKTSNEELSNDGQSTTRNQDEAKICGKPDHSGKSPSISKPTKPSLSIGVPSSASSSFKGRPESKDGSRSLSGQVGTKSPSGLTSNSKSNDISGSTSQDITTKLKSPAETTSQVRPTSPASPTSPTTSSGSRSPKHTTQVFVSLVKITRTKSTDDTEATNFTKSYKRRSVERIMEAKAEEDSVKSSTEGSESKEEKTTMPWIQARQTMHLQMSTSGEGKKDTEKTEVNRPSSLERCTSSEVTSSYSTDSDSGLRRFSPRTSSFRVISQTEPSPSLFTRSASLRIPYKTFKLDAHLEKYASALQKSEMIKSPTRKTMDLFPIPEGVASKRSLFERETGSSGTSTPTSTKSNTGLSSGVSSRINQWMKNTQEEASPNSGSKDAKKIDIASKRSLWEQRSLSTDKS